MQRARQVLRETFGYDDFRLEQAGVIAEVLAGRDALALMPTGGGKSLCYQIPALLRPGVAVVVSPLIALMEDQVAALRQLGLRAACLNSALDAGERAAVAEALRRGELDLLYLAPERLLGESMLALLGECPLALFAIDEAHCVSQWGHDFRPEYQQLRVLAERFPGVPRLALTATADARTRAEIVEQLALHEARQFISSFDRPNIRYTISEGDNPRERLWRFIRDRHPEDAGIVYCLSRRRVEQVAAWLGDKGRVALPYHAGLPDAVRRAHQQRFQREEGVIVVATIAFGMGIDKPDVRFVAHLNLPRNIESYYQETGRAGRDGAPADAWLAYGLQDVITLRQMLESGEGSELYKRVARQKLDAMLGLCEMAGCRRQALLAYFDEPLAEPCGNCDNCLDPPPTWDATEAARMALSCVYRTGQRFGVNHVVNVLLGRQDERIARWGHDRLSTWGIGGDLDQNQWRALFRQLIALGYLQVDTEGHGGLRLAERARPLLRGEETLQLRQFRKPARTRRTRATPAAEPLGPDDDALFQALRRLRKELADAQGVPPYVIFNDRSLLDMVRLRPADRTAFLQVSGVGEHKAERYADPFLAEIARHPRNG